MVLKQIQDYVESSLEEKNLIENIIDDGLPFQANHITLKWLNTI